MTIDGGRWTESRPTATDGSGRPEPSFSLDELLDLLVDRRRRALVECLETEADPTVSLDEAVEYVTNRVADETGRRPNEDDVELELLHHHVPRLADDGVLEFDARSETIRYVGSEQLERFHEHVREFGGE